MEIHGLWPAQGRCTQTASPGLERWSVWSWWGPCDGRWQTAAGRLSLGIASGSKSLTRCCHCLGRSLSPWVQSYLSITSDTSQPACTMMDKHVGKLSQTHTPYPHSTPPHHPTLSYPLLTDKHIEIVSSNCFIRHPVSPWLGTWLPLSRQWM